MTNDMLIAVTPAPGTGLAENKDAAREIRTSQILPALSRGDKVVLDFGAVEFTTQSFVHALIASPIQEFGRDILTRLEFRNCNANVKSVILAVVNYTLRSVALGAGDDTLH